MGLRGLPAIIHNRGELFWEIMGPRVLHVPAMRHNIFKALLNCWEPVQEHLVIIKKLNLGFGCLVYFHSLCMVFH